MIIGWRSGIGPLIGSPMIDAAVHVIIDPSIQGSGNVSQFATKPPQAPSPIARAIRPRFLGFIAIIQILSLGQIERRNAMPDIITAHD
jgi:hypothetical protein